MLEQFFTQPKVLRRLQEGVFGPYLPAFSESLRQEGYSKPSSIWVRSLRSPCPGQELTHEYR